MTEPFPENDPANMAYFLNGDYFSFFTLKKLSHGQLRKKLSSYDLVFVAIDHREFDTVLHIVSACEDRLATYSEGNIQDYQLHAPIEQAKFLQIINQAKINLVYWEKYVPFYRTLTKKPVEYLPYPYLYRQAQTNFVPFSQRQAHLTLPSGFAGNTRNGLGSLAVARKLHEKKLIEHINCWVSTPYLSEESKAIENFLFGDPLPVKKAGFRWRRWLKKSGFDYRPLLKLKKRHFESETSAVSPEYRRDQVSIYRRRPWPTYVREMAKTRLVVDMNTRITVGRNALDCAAVGVPCISTSLPDIQPRLFPDITVADSWDLDAAVEMAERLLVDDDFYRSVTEKASEAVRGFGEAAFLHRFKVILDRYPQLHA